jgi:hypothetical protein
MLRYNTDTIYEGLSKEREEVSANTKAAGSKTWLWLVLIGPLVLLGAFFLFRKKS